MIQYLCDRCGEEVPELNRGDLVVHKRPMSVRSKALLTGHLHLCARCYQDFSDWLRSGAEQDEQKRIEQWDAF